VGQVVALAPATFSDAGSHDSHTAEIDWDDGSPVPGTVGGTAGSGTVAGSHAYTVAGSYTVTVTVRDDDHPGVPGQGSDSLTVTVEPAPDEPPEIERLVFTPVADSWVNASRQSRNYGTATRLQVRASRGRSFVRFNVRGVSGTVVSAKLRMYVADRGRAGTARRVTASWRERFINWNNRPTMGPALDSAGIAAKGTWVEFDVTSAFASDVNTPHSFAISGGSTNLVKYHSREGSKDPRLIIEYEPGVAATVAEEPPKGSKTSVATESSRLLEDPARISDATTESDKPDGSDATVEPPTPEPRVEPEPEPTAEPEAEPESEPEPTTEPQPTTEPEPTTEPDTRPEPKRDPKPEPEPEPETNPPAEFRPAPEATSDPSPEPAPDTGG
jgi:hypothetical protein